MWICGKSALAALVAGMLVGATSVAPPASAVPPNTLVNSAPNLSIFTAQKGGIYVGGPLFSVVIPSNTTLQTSTQPWMNQSNNTIVIPKLPTVSGTVTAKDIDPRGSVFAVTSDKTYRYFKGNGLPSTPMGKFGPVQPGTPAYPYYSAAPGGTNTTPGTPGFGQNYPNAAAIGISPYNLDLKVPLAPKYLNTPQSINYLITGVALTGTVWHAEIANASSTAWYNPISILPLDQCYGHPYSQQYHLHAYSWKCFPNQGASGPSPLFGYALDGFGIYGPRGADGKEITNAQLDECHGMTSPVLWNGKVQNIYHYVLNSEYPYSVGCFRGVVDPANVANTVLPRLGQPMSMPGMGH
ncbi:hypothetical protein BH09ACT7_BH09ACT7_33410 [soil metagenome]